MRRRTTSVEQSGADALLLLVGKIDGKFVGHITKKRDRVSGIELWIRGVLRSVARLSVDLVTKNLIVTVPCVGHADRPRRPDEMVYEPEVSWRAWATP